VSSGSEISSAETPTRSRAQMRLRQGREHRLCCEVRGGIASAPSGQVLPRVSQYGFAALLEACVIEPRLPGLARVAGEAIAAVTRQRVAAVAMASAARRGDRVSTADFADLDLH